METSAPTTPSHYNNSDKITTPIIKPVPMPVPPPPYNYQFQLEPKQPKRQDEMSHKERANKICCVNVEVRF